MIKNDNNQRHNKKIGIALFGAGRAGMIHALNFQSQVPGVEIVAVADPYEQTAIEACKQLEIDTYYTDYKQALSDHKVKAVIIATPTKYHQEIAVDSAQAGKHILCEKPMAMTAEECDCMIAAADSAGVKLQLAFMRRYDSGFQRAKEAIESGVIGELVMIRSNTRGPSIPQPWMYDIKKSNGPLAEVNSHDIDTLRWFTGSEFASLYAIGGNYRCPEAAREWPDFYDNVVMTASFKNGMQGMIDGAQGVAYGYDSRTELLGTKGCVFIGRTNETSVTVCNADSTSGDFAGSWKTLFKDAYLAEDIDFVRCITEDSPPRVTGHDGKMAVKVVDAGNLSIREHRIVTL